MARVRAARARLAQHAAEHPEAFAGRSAGQWETILQENETMGNDPKIQVALRLPSSLVKSLDAWAQMRMADDPGMKLSRSDAVRMLLARALDAAGDKPSKPSKGGR
jgi:hypothetical protein